MKKAEAFLGFFAVLVGAALACGNGSLNFTSFAGSACTQGVPTQWYQNGDTTCASCVSKYCGAEEKCLTQDCTTYGQCFCACGVGDLSCYSACQPQLSSTCTSCEATVSSCVASHCTSSCGDGGVSSSGGGSADGGPTAVCATLAKCCKSQSGVSQMVCNEVASNNDVSVCQAAYAGLLDAGACH